MWQTSTALDDEVVRIYAPLPARSLAFYVRRLRYAVPQWQRDVTTALVRARARLAGAHVEGVVWYWPIDEDPSRAPPASEHVRLLTPFDPVVHDRARFELLWGWVYRFEAYTPAAKRKLGYYALPLLWRDRMIGWGNLAVEDGELRADFGHVGARPRGAAYARGLEVEVAAVRVFLGATGRAHRTLTR